MSQARRSTSLLGDVLDAPTFFLGIAGLIAAVAAIPASKARKPSIVILALLVLVGTTLWVHSEISGRTRNPTLAAPRPNPSITYSSPKQSSSPTRSPSHQATAENAPTTQAPSSAGTVTAAAPGQSSASPTPTAAQPGPKSVSGTYTFTRQVVTCTYSSCGTTPLVLTLTCPAAGSCVAYWSYWGSHAATFDGTTIDVSFTGTGSINCKGTALPTAVTLNFNVLSWTAGQGGAVRTPTRMQGTYTESSPASDLGCKAAGTQQTVSYG